MIAIRQWTLVLVLAAATIVEVSSQTYDWHSPVDHDIRLSGTYCELRGAHFHHGIDIKSAKGTVGDPIYSVGDGYVCRIKINHGGYGQAIYIRHPEGVMTVYAHLDELMKPVADRVLRAQLDDETYEIDLELAPDEIPVKAGQQIGRMGNTGYSFGPHLHFEMRDSLGDITINPLDHGITIKDDVRPTVSHLRWHQVTADGIELDQGVVDMEGDITLRRPPGRYALSVRTYDRMTGTPNRNGVEHIELRHQDRLLYLFHADTVGFDGGRMADMLKTMSDQPRQRYWYRMHGMPCLEDTYDVLNMDDEGYVWLTVGDTVVLSLSVTDWSDNRTDRSVRLIGVEEKQDLEMTAFNYHLPCDEPNVIERGSVRLIYEPDGFFRDQWLKVDLLDDRGSAIQSPVVMLSGDYLGYQHHGRISFDMARHERVHQDRMVVVRCAEDMTVIGGERNGERLDATIFGHGGYALYLDTIAPSVKIISFAPEQANGRKIVLSLEDDIEPKGGARDVIFEASIDGRWIPMRYDLTKYRLVYRLQGLAAGAHRFELRYQDHAGNEGAWSRTFHIK